MEDTIGLNDGDAVFMGEGIVTIRQTSEYGPQSVVLSVEDLQKLLDFASN